MITTCQKCGYQRTEADDQQHPHYSCPNCGVVYEKISTPPRQGSRQTTPTETLQTIKNANLVAGILIMISVLTLLITFGLAVFWWRTDNPLLNFDVITSCIESILATAWLGYSLKVLLAIHAAIKAK